MRTSIAGSLAGALAVCLALAGCGGADSSTAVADPVLSDLAAKTLLLSSDDVESEREQAAPTYRYDRYNLEAVIYRLRTVAAPLFQHYGLRFGEDWTESRAFRTMIGEVSFVVKNGVVTVTNKATGGVIFTGQLNNVVAGVFSPENIPGATDGGTVTPPPPPPPATLCIYTYSAWAACQSNSTQARTVASSTPAGCTGTPVLSQPCVYTPPVLDGAALYTQTCSSCHGPLATSTKLGRTADQITTAGMTKGLTPEQVQAVASALAVATPPACSYTLGAWGACQSNGTQTRTVTSFPAACTGTTPASSQACTYVPPVVTCSSFTYSAFTPAVCPATGQQTRTVATSSPVGCTGGSPVLNQACTYVPPVVTCTSFTYSAFTPAVCPASGQQTRTVATSSPVGCTGGSPVLNQACTYVPPVVTCSSFTYSAWNTCSASGTQSRTVTASAPAGCTGGTPVLTQACTPPPVACTSFTYSALTPAVCPSSGQQTRTVTSSAPAGCTGGTPVLTVACTYVPPVTNPVTLADVTTTCTACHGLTVNTTVFQSGGYSASGRNSAGWVSSLQGMLGSSWKPSVPAGATLQNYADFLATVK